MIGMNLDGIKIGDKFTTMTKLYKTLDLPNVKGNQKVAQDKEIATWIKYELTGTNKRAKNEIIITKIYNTPKEKIDGRITNKGADIRNTMSRMYDDLMEQLIMNCMNENDGQIIESYYTIVYDLLGLVTEEYNNTTLNGYKALATKLDSSAGLIRTYILKSQNIIRNSFESSLNRLQKQGYITYDVTFKVYRNGDAEPSILEDNETIANIMLTEKWAYDEMEITNKDGKKRSATPNDRVDIDFNKKFKKFVCKNLDDSDIYSYFKVYLIDKGINYDGFKLLSSEEVDIVKQDLINRYVVNVHEKVIKCRLNKWDSFKPYGTDKNIKAIVQLDKLLWNTEVKSDFTNRRFISVMCYDLFDFSKTIDEQQVAILNEIDDINNDNVPYMNEIEIDGDKMYEWHNTDGTVEVLPF